MTNDIKKAIEVLTFHSGMYKKYKSPLVRQSPEDRDLENAIDVILDLTRWRKVEEELPEEVALCRCSLPVLTKDKYGVYRVAISSYRYNDFLIGNTSVHGITEWRPINK